MKKLAVTALILNPNEDGTVLMVSRKDNHKDFGLVGGTVEINETLEYAIRREAVEETGLEIVECLPIFERRDTTHEVTTFLCTVRHTNIQTSEKGAVRFGSWEELKAGSFGEYNANLEAFFNDNKECLLKLLDIKNSVCIKNNRHLIEDWH